MKSKNNFIIDLKVYPFDVMISIGQTNNELKKKLKKSGIKTKNPIWKYGKTYRGLFVLFKNNAGLIRLKKPPIKPYDKGVLAHEVSHYVSRVLDRIGMEWNTGSDEAYTYLTQYLTTEIYKRL